MIKITSVGGSRPELLPSAGTTRRPTMHRFRYFLSALAVAPLLIAEPAFAGLRNAAGTLLSEDGGGNTDLSVVIGIAVAAVAVVVYLKWRKSK
jgi:hypothetical protein